MTLMSGDEVKELRGGLLKQPTPTSFPSSGHVGLDLLSHSGLGPA